MNSLPENISSQTKNSRSSKSDLAPIGDLLNLFLDLERSEGDSLPEEETLVKNLNSSPEASNLDKQETEKEVQFNSDSSNFHYPEMDTGIESQAEQEIT
ncbi:MAG: hypothetical protein QNJ53_22030, partial [Pleurocapsa sp. MO_192.B19]|nr:hypothetical protein [Pleurocapsa sp. MO_192.B19]